MTGLLGVLLALVPSLSVLAEPSLPAAVLALALTALYVAPRRRPLLVVTAPATVTGPAYDDLPLPRDRATDPGPHPQRPRAPGTR